MREIKFRAWDSEGKRMSEPFTFVEITQYEHIFEKKFPPIGARFNKLIWLEYTGLKDKNGKEIYDGDIVKTSVIQYYEQRSFPEYVDLREWSVIDVLEKIEWRDYGFWLVPIQKYKQRCGDITESYLEAEPLYYLTETTDSAIEQMVIDGEIDKDDAEKLKTFEVIGNIYENPELLK